MVNLDYYASTGFALELLAQSRYHKQHHFGDYFRTEILPALWRNQARFYLTDDGVPTAMVTWAWLNEDVEKDLHATGRSLDGEEWNCGDRLFFNDWVTPYNNIREVVYDMAHNIFPDQTATSLRRNQDGSVRRINRWTGATLRCDQEAVA
ncbi:cytolysin-activating lysine-acyltransferase [Loktanella ponticola]|uniref:RTX toxin-activating lysine-acyltransferase n=1 Tax=Yoonia ponticola TaxID=1524255 RepID=A0A7W9EZS2_9RHOB|nr:toxin-activating lysine-acyltransferase [Yoonia ponticola]MBB5724014.1 cytolysin-activating lysine-acyltransferase [Yoonia ponticola]